MANAEMIFSNLEAIEFLNLDGLDEAEKFKVLDCLRHNDSSVQLPWSAKDSVADSKHTLNNNHDTQDYYETSYPPSYQTEISSTQDPEYPGQQHHYSLLHPLYNCYSPNITNPNVNYVCAPHEVCYIVPVQPYQIVPNPGYYEPSVSCTYDFNADSSVYSNNANNDPSAAAPSNTLPMATDESQQVEVTTQPAGPGPELKNDVVANGETKTNGHTSPPPPQTASKSWASLFKSSGSCDTVTVPNGLTGDPFRPADSTPKDKNAGDQRCPIRFSKCDFDPVSVQLAEFLTDHIIDHKSVSLQPRGLLNRSNYCYINSILQALLACPQVYHLFKEIDKILRNNYGSKKRCTIDKMCQFIKEFDILDNIAKIKKTDKTLKKEEPISINCGIPFEPTCVYKMLNGKSDSFQIEGRQEDAEEFLGVLLNALNDEMVEHMNLLRNTAPETQEKENEDDNEWHVMGKKNRGSITRKAEFRQTPISTIFGGLLKSRVQRNGGDPTDNIQPFFTLQLNIKKVKTVGEALETLANKIQLEGVMCTKTNKEVEAWQQTTINQLPEVLILHLKCFDYRVNGCTKIMKMVEFPIDLEIEHKLLSSTVSIKEKDRHYKLYAVVYHDGKEASKGHYFTDAYHPGYGTWLRYDDAIVKSIQEEQVLKPQGNRVPYLLFYRRSDRIK